MKKALNIFFVILGVIFFIILIVGALFLAIGMRAGTGTVPIADIDSEAGDQHPSLSPAQEAALKTFGVDPDQVPNEITPEQEACFVEKLGQERVNAIKDGAAPSAQDLVKARGCL